MSSGEGRNRSEAATPRINNTEHFDVFFSHSSTDADWVEALARVFEDHTGLKVWLDRWVLIPGKEWQQQIARAISSAASCAIFYGTIPPQGWFDQEVQRAISRHARDKEFRVIPVLLPGSNSDIVDNFVELRQWVDFRAGITDSMALHRLVSGVRGVPPGRGPNSEKHSATDVRTIDAIRKLRSLSALHESRLLEDELILEYKRKIIDRLLEL